ncbi:MAG: CBS domain-containing protein [Myxococcales bacterium]|nr:CBS domain-containing protein [Myxococcales bacterium]
MTVQATVALDELIVSPRASIKDAMMAISKAGLEVALICELGPRIVGMVTDGDIRRALLRGESLESGIMVAANTKFARVGPDVHRSEAVRLMLQGGYKCLPVVAEDGTLLDLHTLWVAMLSQDTGSYGVIMAGGKGERLGELTQALPKPMLPVGDRPILEHIVQLLVSHGIRRIFLSVNYMAAMIQDHFGDGSRFYCKLSYLHEENALGTAGPLRLLPGMPARPLVVMNGDLLTSVNVSRMLALHQAGKFEATVALREHTVRVPYGVCHKENGRIVRIEEKPELRYHINAGIYVLEPRCLELVPAQGSYSMTTLLEECLRLGRNVGAYDMLESWQDIGLPAEFASARAPYG